MNKPHILKRSSQAFAIAVLIAATPTLANTDSDRDGLSSDKELELGTSDSNADSDGGGANDGWEIENGFDPLDPSDDSQLPIDLDSDNDGIADADEGNNPMDMDSDGDGVPDTLEIGLIDEDRDGFLDDLTDLNNNGMPDVAEALAISGDYSDFDNDGKPDYLDLDGDNDGIQDYWEYDWLDLPADFPFDPWDIDGDGFLNGTDLDTDGDGKLDSVEYNADWSVSDADGDGVRDVLDADDTAAYRPFDTNLNTDSDDWDHDGLTNDQEQLLGTDPKRSDTDGGGVLDGWEVEQGFDPNNSTDDAGIPVDLDIDNDGVLNEFEGANAKDADSDGDGISDANEIGLIDADNDGFLDDLSDINNNGMPDVAEALAITLVYPDFDGDGYSDHLDADSDNDGVHDKIEYDTSWVPEGFVGNPLDIDNDGQLNATDLDSDNDGIHDFDEQATGSFFAPPDINGINYNPTKTANGQINELADNDGDGIPNQADANGGADSDGDGIANEADIDSPLRWNRQDDCVLYYCYLVQTYDDDGDGIQNEYDWDKNGDGALDFSASALLLDTADNDGIPAIFDFDDQAAYVAPVPNSAPTLSQPVPEGLSVSAELPLDLSIIAIVDADNDVLSFDLVDGYNGGALPNWLTFDPITRQVTLGDTQAAYEGILLNYIADDGKGGVLTTEVYITIVKTAIVEETELPDLTEPVDETETPDETTEVIVPPVTDESPIANSEPETNETPETIGESETDAPSVGAANSSGGGAFGLWTVLLLLLFRVRSGRLH